MEGADVERIRHGTVGDAQRPAPAGANCPSTITSVRVISMPEETLTRDEKRSMSARWPRPKGSCAHVAERQRRRPSAAAERESAMARLVSVVTTGSTPAGAPRPCGPSVRPGAFTWTNSTSPPRGRRPAIAAMTAAAVASSWAMRPTASGRHARRERRCRSQAQATPGGCRAGLRAKTPICGLNTPSVPPDNTQGTRISAASGERSSRSASSNIRIG